MSSLSNPSIPPVFGIEEEEKEEKEEEKEKDVLDLNPGKKFGEEGGVGSEVHDDVEAVSECSFF